MSEWREQYDRMRRWRRRIAYDPYDPERARDNFLAFAQPCSHVVDWLENDRSQPIRRVDADRYVDATAPLTFCRDVCNGGSKHARLEEKGVSLDQRLSTVNTVAVGADGQLFVREDILSRLSVWFVDTWVPVLAVADLCIAAWEVLLIRRGLLVDST